MMLLLQQISLWGDCFANPYLDKPQKLTPKVKDELAYYRPAFYGLAKDDEIQQMDSKTLSEVNEAAFQLMDEQATVFASKIAEFIAPMLGLTTEGG